MKILQLCIKPPYPPVDGGTLAMNSVTQGLLANGHSLRLLTMCSEKHPVRKEALTDDYLEKTHFESVFVDLGIHPLDAAVALLCGESYNVKRFESKDFDKKLTEILQEETFDVVHVESIFLTPYLPTIRKHSNARVVLRAHNVEHKIWEQVARVTKNPIKRWYLKKLALALRLYELEHVNDYDGVACITDDDADFFRRAGCRRPLAGIPFGVVSEPIENVEEEPRTLFHIGSMDWRPNEESVRWFLREVWPLVHAELPDIKLYLAGRKMPADLMELQQEGVVVVGEVPDAGYFIASKQINIVPLQAGSGIRVKIIEAMSLGKTVITTSVGAQGINYSDGKNLLIADTPEMFLKQIKRCVEDEDFCHKLGEKAYELILSEYGNDTLTEKLTAFYNNLPHEALS